MPISRMFIFFIINASRWKYLAIMILLLTTLKNHNWWPKCSSKCNKISNFWWISYSYIIIILHLKFDEKTSLTISLAKYIFHFSYCVTNINLVQICSSHTKFSSFVNFFLKIWLSQVLNFSNLPKVHNIISSLVYTYCWNFKMQKKLYFIHDNNFGGF
jgi:hypothetical protein